MKNIRFYWMYGNPEGNDKEYLSSLLDDLENAGYYSVMFPYDPFLGDWMLKIAPVTKMEYKIKYLFAIRTYAISPEYMAMMLNQFDEYYPNKAMLNVLAGDKTQMSREQEIDDTLNSALLMDRFFKYPEERIVYTNNWLNKFVNLKILKRKPEIAITGTSDLTLQNVKEYGDYVGCMNYAYINETERYNLISEKRIVVAPICLVDTEKEYLDMIKRSEEEESFGRHSAIIGTKEIVIKKLRDLSDLGATDIMISKHHSMKDPKPIHDLVKYILDNNIIQK